MKQLVYRLETQDKTDAAPLSVGEFEFVENERKAMSLFRPLVLRCGVFGTLKALAKLASGKRAYYCILVDDVIVSDAWVRFGWCRHYEVERESVVVGPVRTKVEYRGRGMAKEALKRCVNILVLRGVSIFYVHTREDNKSMQAVLGSCGFGPPVTTYDD